MQCDKDPEQQKKQEPWLASGHICTYWEHLLQHSYRSFVGVWVWLCQISSGCFSIVGTWLSSNFSFSRLARSWLAGQLKSLLSRTMEIIHSAWASNVVPGKLSQGNNWKKKISAGRRSLWHSLWQGNNLNWLARSTTGAAAQVYGRMVKRLVSKAVQTWQNALIVLVKS